MKKRMLLGLVLLAAPLAALNTQGDITLIHLADGLQWTTTFTILNLDTQQASYTLYFYDDNGNPLNVGIEGIAGAVPSVSGVLAVNGSAVIQTTGGSTLRQGWARLNSSQILGAQAVFVEHTSVANYEAAVPPVHSNLYSDSFRIAFDNTSGYFTGVAIANWDQLNPVTLTAIFRDQTGAQILSAALPAPIKAYGHTALLLNLSFPETAGRIGTVDFSCAPSFCQISGIGLRFDPNGPFTSTLAYGL